MKKLILSTIMLLMLVTIAGCTKEDLTITPDEISVNTFLAKSTGELQVATVENFDKDYYDLKELEDFVTAQIETYNAKAGEKKITVNDVQKREDKAIMVLTYSGMEAYATFNEVTAAYFIGGTPNVSLDLPSTLINTKNDSLASTEEVLQNNKYKILVLKEPYTIVVDGKVKYYSENAVFVDENTIQAAEEGLTVVVFR